MCDEFCGGMCTGARSDDDTTHRRKSLCCVHVSGRCQEDAYTRFSRDARHAVALRVRSRERCSRTHEVFMSTVQFPRFRSLSLDGDLSTIASDVTLIPSDIGGLVAADRLRARFVHLSFPGVMIAAPSAATCRVAKSDCVFFERARLILGRVARVLLAKTYAVMKLFEHGKDVFVCDSDVAIFRPMHDVWRGELANASLVVQEEIDRVVLNSGMLRVQHVSRAADATVSWLLREWVRRLFTVGFTAGCSGCDQPILNELVHNLVLGKTTLNVIALSDAFAYPSSQATRSNRRDYTARLTRLARATDERSQALARERGLDEALGRPWQRRSVSAWMKLLPPKKPRLHGERLHDPLACIDDDARACYPHILKSAVSASHTIVLSLR